MTDPTVPPIVVHATPTQPQINAAVRQVILAAGMIVGALGAKSAFVDQINGLVTFAGPVAAVVAFLWGQWETRRSAQKAAALAVSSPLGATK